MRLSSLGASASGMESPLWRCSNFSTASYSRPTSVTSRRDRPCTFSQSVRKTPLRGFCIGCFSPPKMEFVRSDVPTSWRWSRGCYTRTPIRMSSATRTLSSKRLPEVKTEKPRENSTDVSWTSTVICGYIHSPNYVRSRFLPGLSWQARHGAHDYDAEHPTASK